MNETKIFCSVIVFTLGVYTIILLQYELYKLNNLNTKAGDNHGGKSKPNQHNCPTYQKTKFNLNRLNCGSAGELLQLSIQNCTELPCDILPDANYNATLNFKPSRNISQLEVQTFVRQKKDLKYSHKDVLNVIAVEGMNTTLKFSFTFPAHHFLSPKILPSKCPKPGLYMIGLEIWDVPSGIGEVCMVVPMTIAFNT